MKKVKNKSFSQFKRMSKERQLKEIGSMTKRANVRMKLLEDNKIHNGILEQTKEILTNMGRTNGKFYEGKKYKDEQELFNVFNKEYVIVTFLSVLDLTRKQEIEIRQERNFDKIFLIDRGI